EHREDGLSVELGRDDERGRHRVVEQLRGRAGLADELIALVAPLRRKNGRDRAGRGAGQLGLTPGVELIEVAANDVERQVVVTLHREHEAQAMQVGGRELAVAGLGASRADELALLEEAELRRGEVGELRAQPRENLPDAEEVRSEA